MYGLPSRNIGDADFIHNLEWWSSRHFPIELEGSTSELDKSCLRYLYFQANDFILCKLRSG